MTDEEIKEYADKALTETQEKNKLLSDILLENATHLNKHDKWVITYQKKSFTFWKDHRNDCWCLQLPNHEITDYSYKDNIIDDILFYIKNY